MKNDSLNATTRATVNASHHTRECLAEGNAADCPVCAPLNAAREWSKNYYAWTSLSVAIVSEG